MTRDKVIALAREAGLYVGSNISGVQLVGTKEDGDPLLCHITVEELSRFANLIEDHLTWSDLHTCNPGCTKPPCVSMRKAEAHAAAVEREACAKVAETLALDDLGSTDDWPDAIAAAIRSRA